MEEEILALLGGLGFTAKWGGLGQGKSLPRIALYRVSGQKDTTLDGGGNHISGRIQVDCYAETFVQANAVSRAVEAALNGYRGTAVWHVALVSIRDRADEVAGNTIQRVSLDFSVLYASG